MTHLAFPNIRRDGPRSSRFWGCVRCLSLPVEQSPLGPPYARTELRTFYPEVTARAVALLIPEAQEHSTEIYHIADAGLTMWQGPSMEFTYLLAQIRCSRPLALQAADDLGDIWCTGAVGIEGTMPVLKTVTQAGFQAKLAGFCAQTQDHLFFVPQGNLTGEARGLCATSQVSVLSLTDFRLQRAVAPEAGRWTGPPAVIGVGTLELPRVVATLFQPPKDAQMDDRPPYKYLDPFEPRDAGIFHGRDHDIARLQRAFSASRLLIVYGASGMGKTSLVQAGLLPSLAAERYAWVIVRLVEAHPTEDIKKALVNTFGIDRQYLAAEQPLVEAVRAAAMAVRKTVIIVVDQGEEMFQRYPRVVRQQFARDLGVCLDEASLDVQVIMTLREDYFHRLGEFQDTIPRVFNHTLRLTRLTSEQALEAMVQPVQQAGWDIDATLVEEVVLPLLLEVAQEVATPLVDEDAGIDPPLLAIVCDALYEHAAQAQRTTIGPEDYAALGDIRTILGRYLETTLPQFGTQQRQARAVLKTW